VYGVGCHDEATKELTSSRQDVSMQDLSNALGCDTMRGTPYDVGPFLRGDGPPDTTVEVERARDCYRDGRFVGRVHIFGRSPARDVIAELTPIRQRLTTLHATVSNYR
jgi:hypothetical protein